MAATVHMDLVAELYAEQLDARRYFLHEHPLQATSWELVSMKAIMQLPGVQRVHGDQCMFGAEIKSGEHRGDPVQKPTGLVTNAPAVARAFDVQCTSADGMCSRRAGGRHRACSGKHAAAASVYPRGLQKRS